MIQNTIAKQIEPGSVEKTDEVTRKMSHFVTSTNCFLTENRFSDMDDYFSAENNGSDKLYLKQIGNILGRIHDLRMT